MKRFSAFIVLLLTTSFLASQNDILGQWFFTNASVNNVEYPNTLYDWFDLNLLNNNNYNGTLQCNGYGGSYSITNSTITFNDMTVTLEDCGSYESYYLTVILYDQQGAVVPLNYTISGTGNNAILTITNPSGNFVTYSRQTLSNTKFNKKDIAISKTLIDSKIELTKTDLILNKSFQIFSIEGKLINKGLIKSNTINVNNLSQGLYFLKVDDLKPIRFIKL